jgi:hypothetical protein
MKCHLSSSPRSLRAMSLVELLFAVGLGALLLGITAVLFLFGLRSFAALGNYASLTGQSHLALDRISREIQEASQVIEAQTNLPVKWLTLSNAMANPPVVIKYTWDSTSGVLTCEKTGQPIQTNLTCCDAWDFSFFQAVPSNHWSFYPTSDPALCRSIGMSWKCSRTILGQKLTTEEALSAQIVRRNKS